MGESTGRKRGTSQGVQGQASTYAPSSVLEAHGPDAAEEWHEEG